MGTTIPITLPFVPSREFISDIGRSYDGADGLIAAMRARAATGSLLLYTEILNGTILGTVVSVAPFDKQGRSQIVVEPSSATTTVVLSALAGAGKNTAVLITVSEEGELKTVVSKMTICEMVDVGPRKLTLDDVRNGVLLEANRQFFHRYGLALAVEVDVDSHGSSAAVLSVMDFTGDPEGMEYPPERLAEPDMLAKYAAFHTKYDLPERVGRLGFDVQPMPTTAKKSPAGKFQALAIDLIPADELLEQIQTMLGDDALKRLLENARLKVNDRVLLVYDLPGNVGRLASAIGIVEAIGEFKDGKAKCSVTPINRLGEITLKDAVNRLTLSTMIDPTAKVGTILALVAGA
jgi:hypothetical protein